MQLTYNQYNDVGAVGMIADTSLRQIDSFLAQGAVGIGKAVVLGTDKVRQCVQAGTGAGQGALIVGISVMSQSIEQTAAGVVQYVDKASVPVMTKGRIWVETNDAVVANTPANFHLASGKFTDAAVGAGIEAFALVQVRFKSGTTGPGLAVVEIDNA